VLAIVAEMTESLGFTPSVRMEERLDALVPAPTAEHMLAVLREALSNAGRHADATRGVPLPRGDQSGPEPA
jgi:two-component system, NarL family, sensor histidine kinase DevS